DAAESVLGARPVLHDEDSDAVARGDLGDGVAHVQADALLAHHDGADVGLGGAFDDRVDRIADQELDALLLEDMGNGISDFHGGAPRLIVTGLSWSPHRGTGLLWSSPTCRRDAGCWGRGRAASRSARRSAPRTSRSCSCA